MSFKRKWAAFALLGAMLFVGAGCATRAQYQDPNALDPMGTGFEFGDVKDTAAVMISSMLASPALNAVSAERRAIIMFGRIKNETDQHINMADVQESIASQLVESGRFRITNAEGRQDMKDEIDYQNRSGMVNRSSATASGQQLGAEYILTGRLVSYKERFERQVRKTYQMTLKLSNLQSGIVEWQKQAPITKVRSKGVVGW